MKIKELIALLETLDQEAIINDMDTSAFETELHTLDLYILENYQEIEDGIKYNTAKYKINYLKGTIKLQYSQPTTELDISINQNDSKNWKDCIVCSDYLFPYSITLGE